jgi:hypothetical protein
MVKSLFNLAWWRARSQREQRALQIGGMVLLGLWLWRWVLSAAWHTWVHSEPMHAQLDQHMAQMQAMQQQWHALSEPTTPSPEVSLQTLQALVEALGDRARSRHASQQFFVESRVQSHARVSEAHWQSVDGQWNGQLVLTLPGGR